MFSAGVVKSKERGHLTARGGLELVTWCMDPVRGRLLIIPSIIIVPTCIPHSGRHNTFPRLFPFTKGLSDQFDVCAFTSWC